MDELHPLFRNDVPSADELKSNDVYSALVEISAQKPGESSVQRKHPPLPTVNKISSKVSSISKGIQKVHPSERHIKGRYQRHLNRVRATRSMIERKRDQEQVDNKVENHSSTESGHDQERRELAEMELCMSIWSNKDVFSG
ncbi:hypothetical protein OIY81_47 [Cryptosporidium canis]|uniref:Uncharacterized protein n=1 Tax=Cryptosporidium canis TaxID=195482 RepID=A0ABQ8P8H2_9CRYT|nr:hypothetical protein OJ252_1647 [Cryptosporidium canis]KAJ1615047.1 hypothetical protein OIY81_47 [Cryptosporidium canis]